MTPYFIAETAFHHEGDLKFLKELMDFVRSVIGCFALHHFYLIN